MAARWQGHPRGDSQGAEAHLVGLDQLDARVQADLTNKCFSSVWLVLVELRHGQRAWALHGGGGTRRTLS